MKKNAKTKVRGGAGRQDGNQFRAFRVEPSLWAAFVRAAKRAEHKPNDYLRQLMADVAVWS